MAAHHHHNHRYRRHESSVLERFHRANQDLEKIIKKINEADDAEPENTKLRAEARFYKKKMLEYLILVMEDAIPSRMRSMRSFRLKYSDEIRTDGLECQLWQAIEGLACGQVIMNRESLSKQLHPMANTLMQHLINTRLMLSQEYTDLECACLRAAVQKERQRKAQSFLSGIATAGSAGSGSSGNDTPGSNTPSPSLSCSMLPTATDSDQRPASGNNTNGTTDTGVAGATRDTNRVSVIPTGEIGRFVSAHYYSRECIEQLCKLDELVSSFEWSYMSMVARKMRSVEEAEDLQDTAVLFSETVQWAHRQNLITYSQITDCDTQFMLALPRLAVIVGCRVYTDGVIHRALAKDPGSHPHLFQLFTAELRFLHRHLSALTWAEFLQLARYLALLDDPPEPQILPCALVNYDESEDFDTDLHDTQSFSSDSEDPPAPKPPISQSQSINHRVHLIDMDLDLHKLPSGTLKRGDIHSLFKLVARVSDMLQSEFASEYRFLMHTVYMLYEDAVDREDDTGPLWTEAETDDLEPAIDALDLLQMDDAEEGKEDDLLRKLDEHLSVVPPTSVARPTRPRWLSFNHGIITGEPLPRSRDTSPLARLSPVHSVPVRPPWQSAASTECCHCERTFIWPWRRRHHCRRCGYEFCGSCWGPRFPIPQMGIASPVPVCIECALILNTTGSITPSHSGGVGLPQLATESQPSNKHSVVANELSPSSPIPGTTLMPSTSAPNTS